MEGGWGAFFRLPVIRPRNICAESFLKIKAVHGLGVDRYNGECNLQEQRNSHETRQRGVEGLHRLNLENNPEGQNPSIARPILIECPTVISLGLYVWLAKYLNTRLLDRKSNWKLRSRRIGRGELLNNRLEGNAPLTVQALTDLLRTSG